MERETSSWALRKETLGSVTTSSNYITVLRFAYRQEGGAPTTTLQATECSGTEPLTTRCKYTVYGSVSGICAVQPGARGGTSGLNNA